MPIPNFTIDGVFPPFVGAHGPGGVVEDMSPYSVTALEVVSTLGYSESRKAILRGWLEHRKALRGLGFNRGFQWLDGSFVEQKDPKDLDIVTFFHRPVGAEQGGDLEKLVQANFNLFDRPQVKALFNLDAFWVDLNGSPEGIVSATRYWAGLFAHRRGDHLWKGMLQVRLENVDDDIAALTMLGQVSAAPSVAGGANP